MNPILACQTCAHAFREAGGDAAGIAIFFLLVVIVAVLGVVAFSIIRMARRESQNLDPIYTDNFTPSSDH
ncbi:MAG: hypothetical protein Q7Q71_00640 [Verrucomicrobiota bacterium JB023]|nr:hypothetical protein [Verrucomicrobiota bacterium JB023]